MQRREVKLGSNPKKNMQTDENSSAITKIGAKGNFREACRRPIPMEQRVNEANCRRNTIPKEETGTENRAENQGTSAGNVFIDIAKPARLKTSPARRIGFNIVVVYLSNQDR